MTKKDWLVYATESSNKRKSIDQEQLEIDEQETIREIYQNVLHLQDIAYIKALILKDLYEDELKKQYAHGLNLPAAERKKYQGRIRTFVRLRDTHSFQMLMSRMVFKRRANRSDKKFDLYQLGMNKEGTNWRLALNRFSIEFGDRITKYL